MRSRCWSSVWAGSAQRRVPTGQVKRDHPPTCRSWTTSTPSTLKIGAQLAKLSLKQKNRFCFWADACIKLPPLPWFIDQSMAIKKGYNFHQSFGLRQFLFISDSSGSNEISDVHLISSLKARQRVKVRHKTGWNICKVILGKVSKVVARQEKLVWSWNRFSAKEGASRSDQARPRTNMQVPTDTSCFEEKFSKMNIPIRHWTGGLVMERVRPMASSARRRGSDPIKPDLRPTSRSCPT